VPRGETLPVTEIRRICMQYLAADMVCEIPLGGRSSPADGLRAVISLARAGNMALSRRRDLPWRTSLFSLLGMEEERVFGLRQVHSQKVVVVDQQQPETLAAEEADGMVTDRTDAVLSATVADCLPIFLRDTVSGAFGLVHSGWKGTGIVVSALRAMQHSYGTLAQNVAVTIGPGIGPCCYHVPEERASLFFRQFGAATVVLNKDGTPSLDLREANFALLRDAGVEAVTVVEDCTSCSEALGSFRRQGSASYSLMLSCIGRWGRGT
jgi:polyphenol oxidase